MFLKMMFWVNEPIVKIEWPGTNIRFLKQLETKMGMLFVWSK